MNDKLNLLIESLKKGPVTFEYTKKDGSTRVATGTLNESFLPQRENDEFELEKTSVDTLVGIKYESLDEYMNENKIELVREDDEKYVFRHKHKKSNENNIMYFDLDKKEFRSFAKENFKRIVS